ncbi:recombinase family protein [Nocardia salmonicida]|uniref:recombinase family protein n=1 Tax=Nocardia salmonicida TaxID=53431 RepID=UPI00340A214F
MNGCRRRGRPRSCPDDVLALIVSMHRGGSSYREIVSELNARGIRTPGGGHLWYPSHLSRLLNTANVVAQFGRPRTARQCADRMAS